MEKKLIRIVSAAIVLALGIGLAGCGKKDEKNGPVSIDGAGEGYEFVAQSKSINELINPKGRLNNVMVKDGKVYAVENSEGKTFLHIADMETGDDKVFELDYSTVFPDDKADETNNNSESAPVENEESSEDEEVPAEEEQNDAEEPTAEEPTAEEPTSEETIDGTVVVEKDSDGMYLSESYSEAYVNEMSVSKDGSLYLSIIKWTGQGSHRAVCKMSADGQLEKMYSLDDVVSEDEGIGTVIFKEDGGIYISSETKIVSLDNTGKKVGTITCDSWINNLFLDDKGNLYATYYGQNGMECKKADFASGSFTESLEAGKSDGTPIPTGDGKYIIAGYSSVYEYDPETNEKKKLWDWINLDITDVDTNSFIVNSDGSFSLVNSDYSTEEIKYEYTKIFKQAITPETARKDIIYGCTNLNWDLRQRIADFNKSQTEYRIRVKSYVDNDGEWNEEEYNNQLARFKADIAAGAIDLMTVEATDYSSVQLAKKGAFLDLSEYYSSVVNRGDYFENILDIFKVDGKDYFSLNKVTLMTMIGNADIFKGKDGWTSKDLVELRKKYPDKEFIEYGTKESAVATMVVFSLGSFVDYEKATCDFCKPAFYDLLNFANTFPKEVDYDDYDVYSMIANGDIIVSELYLSDVSSLSMYRQIMGEDSVIIGPPNDEGIKVQVIPESMFAISSKTKYKEGCYQFLKSLGDENTEKYASYYGFPVQKEAFYVNMKKEITPETYVDEYGETRVVESSYSIGTDSGMIDIRRPTQEDVDIIENLMVNANNTIRIDDKFGEIFLEEIQPFFEGKKTAEETATVLQSRMQIYLSENE